MIEWVIVGWALGLLVYALLRVNARRNKPVMGRGPRPPEGQS